MYKFPDSASGAAADWSIVPFGTIPPEPDENGITLIQSPLGVGTDGVGKVLIMNWAAKNEYYADTQGFLSKVNPTGQIADIPFSEVVAEGEAQ